MSISAANLKTFSEYEYQANTNAPLNTPLERLGEIIDRTKEGAVRWARASIDERIQLARALQTGYLGIAEQSVKSGCAEKGLAFDHPESAEEWITGPWCVVRHLRLIRESLEAIKQHGNTKTGSIGKTVDGRRSVQVFPYNAIDRALFQGCRVDVHMQDGVNELDIEEHRAKFYRGGQHDGRLAVILGAGNLAAIPTMDVITKLFNEGTACVLKMNPVNAYIGPFVERAFAQAIEKGYLSIVYGGSEVGEYLTRHPDVDEIHITGSDKTHDRIVWGQPGSDRDNRLKNNTPLLDKPIYSELGNISPVIVVPGPYTDRQLAYQARDIAGYVGMNASFLCNAAKMLITADNWGGTQKLMSAIDKTFSNMPPRKAYYPGAADRWNRIVADHQEVRRLGDARSGALPWAILPNLDSSDPAEPMFREEPFCAVLGQTAVATSDPVEFLSAAVDFCNERLWGTLSATIIVHPKTMRDPVTAKAVEFAIRRLRYGTVAVNTFPGMSFALGTPPWGGFPGAELNDIQSGIGFVHNSLMLEGIEKSVLRFPLTMFPKPVYHPGHKTAHRVAKRLIALEANMRWQNVPAVAFNAMRG